MTDQTIQPIETVYRGYRFRSRLEARYAVLLDAAGIRWQYEAQGYVVAGRRYLPDFWLTELKCFAEVRGDDERAKEALPLLQALSTASGHPAILLTGDFLDANRPDAIMPWTMKGDARTHVTWR